MTLSGGGTVNLSDATGAGDALFEGNGQTLTNVDNTIQGTGIIGNGSLTVINQATIDANSSAGKGVLELNGSGGVTNTNLLEATGGGELLIENTITNTGGNITADGIASAVVVGNATINGGTLNTTSGGVMETAVGSTATLNGVTISSGSTYTASNNATTDISGTLAGSGTIQLTGGTGNNGVLNLTGNVTLNGGGTVAMTDNSGAGNAFFEGNGQTLTNVNGTITGSGIIGTGSLAVVNSGTINATSAGTGLLVLNGSGGVTNSNGPTGGLLKASGGGVLQINGITVNNDNGNITVADATSTVEVENATIQGGTLNNTFGGGTFETVPGSTANLDGSTAAGAVTINGTYTASNNATTNIKGTITNNGTIQLNGGGGNNGVLNLAGNVTLNGGGTVAMTDNSGAGNAFFEGNSTTLTNANNTISGTGIIGNGSLTVINQATIDATPAGGISTLVLNGSGGVTNTALLQAIGGGELLIENTITNTGGNITASGAASAVVVDNATINGGALNTTSGGVMETAGGSTATLNGVTISSGSTYTASNNATTDINGTITNQGTIQLNGGGGNNGVLNLAGNVTLNGGGTVAMTDTSGAGNAFFEGNGQTLTNVDNTIEGTGIIGNGNLAVINGGTIEASPAGGTSTLTLNGSGGLTNNGTFAANNGGTLTVTVPFTNTGTVHAINGTIDANAGFTGTTGTATIDSTGTLSIGANSTVGTLNQNGNLQLGTNNITVSTDYVPQNFSSTNSGNSFNKLAGVTTTTGQILAAGPTPADMQVITGADVTGGGTTTPTLALGNVHVGASTTYQINNDGTTNNPSLRGAIQTDVNGGNVTPGLLTGSGVTAQNFGPVAPGSATGTYTVTAASAGSLSGQAVHIANNFGNVPEQTLSITGAAYALASPSVTSSLSPMFNFGVVQAGQTYTDQLTIANTLVASNPAYQEGLNASFGTPTNTQLTTNGGSITNLAAGTSNSTALSVSLTPTMAGTIGGTVPINFASNGTTTSGLGITSLPTQDLAYNWTFSGTVVNPANPSIAPTSINFGNVRIDTTQQQALSVTNVAGTPPQASLDAQISGTGAATSNGGSINLLAPGGNDNTSVVAGLNTSNGGAQVGTAIVALQSDSTPNGCTSNCIVDLPSQNIGVSGNVYRRANPMINTPSVNLAARVGGTAPSQAVSITNSSPDMYTEDLQAGFGGSPSSLFTPSGSITHLAAQGTDASTLNLALNTSSAGSFSGSIPVNFTSTGTFGGGAGSDGGAPVGVDPGASVALTGNVYTPAVADVITASPINFGIVHVNDGGGTLAQSVTVENSATATALNDVLIGTISAGATPPFSGSGSLGAGLGPKVQSSALQVNLNTGTAGVFNGTANLALASHDSQLADMPLVTSPLTLAAQVNNYAALAFQQTGGQGSLSGGGTSYDLDFGNVLQNSPTPEALLSFLNDNPLAEQAYTDLLSSSAGIESGSGFDLSGNSVSDLAGGDTQGGFAVGFDTSTLGSFDELLSFDVESSNSSGYDQVIGDVTLNLEGDIVSSAPVPEPSSIALLASSLGALIFFIRRERRRG